MADIFSILNNVYTNPKGDWILELEDSDIAPMIIQRWIVMNDKMAAQARFMDLYTFNLPPRMYLSMLWSITPKSQRPPFVKYIKRKETKADEFEFLLIKIQRQFQLSDRDLERQKSLLMRDIQENMTEYFVYYGIEKKTWEKFGLNYDDYKKFKDIKRGLDSWI